MEDIQGAIRKQLGQLRPANTSAAALYTVASKTQAWVTSIVVSNTTGSAATYSIYNDTDGTTYSEATALAFDLSLDANSTDIWEFPDGVALPIAGGTIGVKTGTSNAITFTAYGLERKIS